MTEISVVPRRARFDARWLLALAVAAAASWWLATFPVLSWALALFGVAAAVLVAWRPVLVFAVVPAVLPVLDLAPWSGRRFDSELDVLIAVVVSVAWARLPPPPTRRPAARATSWAVAWLLFATAISVARALQPWNADPDWDLGNPLGPFNALRIAKGSLWALCLWRLALRLRAGGADVGRAFGWGMTLGLAATVVCIVAERLAFSYLLDFDADYRVAGPFSAMSLGGAYVECFLAVATPFLLARMMPPVSAWRLALGGVGVAAATYSLMVTYSRGGYGAMALALGVFVAAVAPFGRGRASRATAAAAMAALAVAVAYPIVTGAYAQMRLKTMAADLNLRERHWAESLQLMDPSPATLAFGIGLGRYAQANLWHSDVGQRAGGYRLVSDGEGGQALRLGSGYAFFVDQIVPVAPAARYRLSYRYRPGPAVSPPAISLCQKWIVASFECTSPEHPARTPAQPLAVAGTWRTVTATIEAPAAGPGRLPRPVRLSLLNDGRAPLDVDDISLVGPDGVDLVRNGRFDAGMDHWTFTSDNHLAWHSKSLPLGALIETGLVGLIALAAVLLTGVWSAARAAARGHADGAALLAGLCAFATVGSIDTLIDVPQFSMLLLLLCLLPSALPTPAAA